jgi:GPH family glycoside/pentoside/hexuronide:cation symporter
MYVALLPLAVAYFFVWNPPEGLTGQPACFLWLVGICGDSAALFYVLRNTQSGIGSAELTQDYDARTSLMSFSYFFAWVGGLAIQVALLKLLLLPTESVKMSGYLHTWRAGILYGLCGRAGDRCSRSLSAQQERTHYRIPQPQDRTAGKAT